jgi:hypothetical protein
MHNRGYNFLRGPFLEVAEIPSKQYRKVSSEVLTLHFWSISKKAGQNSQYCWKYTLSFLNFIHKQRPNIKQSLLSMILIGIFFVVSSESPSLTAASE